MANSILKPNPHGEVNDNQISEFQREHGISLPKEYIEYLLEFNGGVFENRFFFAGKGAYSDVEICDMYSLNCGPDYSRLESNFDLATSYDLELHKKKLKAFFVFADCTAGNPLVLNLKDGSVNYIAIDLLGSGSFRALKKKTYKLADNFSAFKSGLMSEENWKTEMRKVLPDFDEIQERKERFRREREQEEEEWLRKQNLD